MRLWRALRRWWHVRRLKVGDRVATPMGIGVIVCMTIPKSPGIVVVDYGDRGRYLQACRDCWRTLR